MTEPIEMFGMFPEHFTEELGGIQAYRTLNAKMKLAYSTLQDEICQGCGIPIWIGHSIDNVIQFKIKSTTCYACATLERDREQENKRNSKAGGFKAHGRTKYVVIDEEQSGELPTREHGLKMMPK